DLSGLSGVTLYEPEELVLSAKAGTPLAEIEQLVASRGQELAFEPMDYGPVLGRPMGRCTLGGALATNLSGPRRIKAGAARDHFLRSEEHTSELQSRSDLVCRLLLEKKKNRTRLNGRPAD